jgi:hypothetical protein
MKDNRRILGRTVGQTLYEVVKNDFQKELIVQDMFVHKAMVNGFTLFFVDFEKQLQQKLAGEDPSRFVLELWPMEAKHTKDKMGNIHLEFTQKYRLKLKEEEEGWSDYAI